MRPSFKTWREALDAAWVEIHENGWRMRVWQDWDRRWTVGRAGRRKEVKRRRA